MISPELLVIHACSTFLRTGLLCNVLSLYIMDVVMHSAATVHAASELSHAPLQTPEAIWKRIQKDGASALKEILPKTKLWIPGQQYQV